MRYLNIKQIKRQCVVDLDYKEDDMLLYSLGTAAEDVIEQEIAQSLDDLAEKNGGELPTPLMQAGYMLVDYFYGGERGSSGNDIKIPEAIFRICRLYRKYST